MKFVFIGAGALAVATGRLLTERNHEVVFVERDKARIDALVDELDCGFIHGDGSHPPVLRETMPEKTDALFCLSGRDQDNIIASLVGRSLGFRKVITRIEDEELEHITLALGLETCVVPDRTMGRYLADFGEGHSHAELGTMIKGDAHLLSFVARDEDAGLLERLDLPREARVVCVYRGTDFLWSDSDLELRADDEVVLLTTTRHLESLRAQWTLRGVREA